MKHTIIILTTLLVTTTSFASNEPIDRLEKQAIKEMSTADRVERIAILEDRVSAIQAMDLEALERSERKELKQELGYIDREMKAQASGGIFISTGALIIIILLLILL